jgi:hypothetical protein
MGHGNEAMLGTQKQKTHLNKRGKNENIMGKTPLKVECIKKEMSVARKLCASLQDDSAENGTSAK